MKSFYIGRAFAATLILVLVSSAALAEITRVEIASRADVLDGKALEGSGPYEKIVGKAFFSVDPASPSNKAIVDIDKAPRNAAGQVEFSADLYVLAPKDPTRGNGVALFDILNRGSINVLRDFNRAPEVVPTDPSSEKSLGDAFLLRQGYTIVWLGWQFDVPRRGRLMALDAPPVLENGKPVTGWLSTRFIPNNNDSTYALDNVGRYADTTHYRPVDPDSPMNVLTVRDGFLAQPRVVPRGTWRFGRLTDGKFVPDTSALYLQSGFQAGHVYELSYQATGAVVAGLGFAALRDMSSAVKHQKSGPISARYAYAFGPSQDGRFLREFLYEGFNADEHGERAFDGIIANIAGSARSADFNARFARPNGLAFFTASLFPFLDLDQNDLLTQKTDGLQVHLTPEQRPKIFYTNSSTEYWGGGRAAALAHTTLDGSRDAKVPDNVRIYLVAGTQHLPGGYSASVGPGAQQPNGNSYSWALRALLVAMDHWVRDGVAPPPSAHPQLANGSLVPLARINFPTLPGVRSPLTIPAGYRADLDEPSPTHGLPMLVPQTDKDGNEISGIRLPNIEVPLATYTGWNFRNVSIGQPEELLPLTGSFIPFPVTKAQRAESHDPRLSIEERYATREHYRALVTDAATRLARARYVAADDIPGIVDQALANWDEIVRGTSLERK